MIFGKKETADVCLIVEGTYPYVSGGVSTWVHQVITAMPEVKFALYFLGAEPDPKAKLRYELPKNLIARSEFYLFEKPKPMAAPGPDPAPAIAALRRALAADPGDANAFAEALAAIAKLGRGANLDRAWGEPAAWNLLTDLYEARAPGYSFIDFYWSAYFMAHPLWRLMAALGSIPDAKVYHAICTGYAGAAGAVAARLRGVPLLLSEHGIYQKERLMEIQKARWIRDRAPLHPGVFGEFGALRQLWVSFFGALSGIAYAEAARIVSLFENNARIQAEFGADPNKITIIPNGVRPEEYDATAAARRARLEADPASQRIGFLGRVVSIKDVKTLLRAAAKVRARCPAAEFIIAGPTDEEPAYFEECQAMAQELGLADAARFTGPMDRHDFFREADVMVLTSASEGLPFVIIESFAAGVPVVATDVGACRELIEGSGSDNPAGAVANIGDADAIAHHLIRLIENPTLRDQMGQNGRRRVEQSYTEAGVLEAYRECYGAGQAALPAVA
ncbi:MAG: GT4 family glycosyltransferase PelF [Verrucomicrobiales bacterium]